ncbi:MAG: sigma-54-dependent Fis family transcriptional regulator [Chitinivibrionales bacterium]|nr:sigma-54-dependent Fis family transcriptional regulator [Chitinivibrionales bacterium]
MREPRLFFVDDDETALYGYKRFFSAFGYQTTFARNLKEAKEILTTNRFDVILLDLRLPDGDAIEWIPELKKSNYGIPIIIITAIGDIATAVKAIKKGAENFLTKPVVLNDLKVIIEHCLALAAVLKRDYLHQRLVNENAPFFAENKASAKLMEQARIAARSDMVVLLLGETGTGKGVLARWIHNNSERKAEVFIEVNCASLKGDLLCSELFGHARGAFTSAVKDREGLIELADGGTLFLDEVADMSADVQAQMLKTIEDKAFRRLGENTLRRSDFRLICATHSDLRAEVLGFRRDLYFRISAFPIKLLPLREKREEIPDLTNYFLSNSGYTHFPLSPDIMELLVGYSWPGNTRELKNLLERALLLAQGEVLTIAHFPDLTPESMAQESSKLIDAEDAHILQIIEKFNGDKNKASKALGLSISSLYRRLAKINTTTDDLKT